MPRLPATGLRLTDQAFHVGCGGVLDGSIRDVPAFEPHLLAQLRALTPASFPTRQLQSKYLEWFFRRAVSALGPDVTVTVHRDTATGVVRSSGGGASAGGASAASGGEPDDGAHHVRLASGTEVVADVVVYALGHTDSLPGPESAGLSEFAARHGGFHAPPSYTTDVDYSAIEPGQDVIVSGMGLAFVDLMVLLFEGRGGRFEERSDGELEYVPSGAEPRVWAGSRRGVPYHSKISSVLRGEPITRPRYFTAEAVDALLAEHQELDFRAHLWPLIAKDAGYAYYRELFTGYVAGARDVGQLRGEVRRRRLVQHRSGRAGGVFRAGSCAALGPRKIGPPAERLRLRQP